MKTLVLALGLLVVAVLVGISGGIGAVWALNANAKADCAAEPLCHVASWLGMGGNPTAPRTTAVAAAESPACASVEQIETVKQLTAVLYSTTPPGYFDDAINRETSGLGECPDLAEVAEAICNAVEGGTSGDPAACRAIVAPQ